MYMGNAQIVHSNCFIWVYTYAHCIFDNRICPWETVKSYVAFYVYTHILCMYAYTCTHNTHVCIHIYAQARTCICRYIHMHIRLDMHFNISAKNIALDFVIFFTYINHFAALAMSIISTTVCTIYVLNRSGCFWYHQMWYCSLRVANIINGFL